MSMKNSMKENTLPEIDKKSFITGGSSFCFRILYKSIESYEILHGETNTKKCDHELTVHTKGGHKHTLFVDEDQLKEFVFWFNKNHES